MSTRSDYRFQAVNSYLHTNKPLRTVAKEFAISHYTLWRWVRWYKQGGKANLDREKIAVPWNKLQLHIEKEVVLLKEHRPSLCVARAQKLLTRRGIRISTGGVWSTWRKYGVAGLSGDFHNLILKTLSLVAPRIRKIEEALRSYGRIPFAEYWQKMNSYRKYLEKRSLYYSTARIGLLQLIVLTWFGKYDTIISLAQYIAPWIPFQDLSLKYKYCMVTGIAYAEELKFMQALDYLNICRNTIRKVRNMPTMWHDLAIFYGYLDKIDKAYRIVERILSGYHGKLDDETREALYGHYALYLALAGQYRKCLTILGKMDDKKLFYQTRALTLRARCMLGQTNMQKAQKFADYALQKTKANQITANLGNVTLIWAGIYAALDDEKKGYNIIRRTYPLLKKSRDLKSLFIRKLLCLPENFEKIVKEYPHDTLFFSRCKLVFLMAKANATLKVTDYHKAYRYAVTHQLSGLFHHYSLFISEPARTMIRKGKSTGLPRRMLKLPVFNRDTPVYRVSFLGPLRVYHHRLLRIKLLPRDAAFLIHLALKVQEPNKKILVEDLYENFWKGIKGRARYLSHLLVRLKNLLKIPSHLIYISRGNNERYLVNRGIYFITDYHELEQHLSQADALQRANEWYLSRREYMRAFNLIRGDIFEKMYDLWSENIRTIILNKIEKKIIKFIKECMIHKDHKTARKALVKTEEIIRHAEEIEKLKGIFGVSHRN